MRDGLDRGIGSISPRKTSFDHATDPHTQCQLLVESILTMASFSVLTFLFPVLGNPMKIISLSPRRLAYSMRAFIVFFPLATYLPLAFWAIDLAESRATWEA
jgi:hypothetical protein